MVEIIPVAVWDLRNMAYFHFVDKGDACKRLNSESLGLANQLHAWVRLARPFSPAPG